MLQKPHHTSPSPPPTHHILVIMRVPRAPCHVRSASTTSQVLQTILSACKSLVPSFDVDYAFHSFSGARAKSSAGDWIIERSSADGNFVNAAGIDSPGIAGSPAIALEVVELLREAWLALTADPSFNPRRAPVIVPKVRAL